MDASVRACEGSGLVWTESEAAVKDNDDSVAGLAEKIKALSPSDKLRLAAGLLEAKKAELAYTIMRQVTVEVGATLALSRVPR